MFLLDKWYLDVVTSGGEVAIVYSARLRWGAVRVGYASALEDCGPGAHHESRTLRAVEAPRHNASALTWHNRILDVEGCWQCDAPPIDRTLASTSVGEIRWSCQMLRARASIRIADRTYDGLGYVERLRLTIPPRKLPFDALRWGRHLSDRCSLIWIDWRGAEHQSWVWLNGTEQPAALVTDAGVCGLVDGAELCLEEGRDVLNRHTIVSLSDLLPAVVRRASAPLAGMRERKRVARSSIVIGSNRVDQGWTLHELVTW
jgi:hypothetical protein